MNKTKTNISMFDNCSLTRQRELLHDAFKPHDIQKGTVIATEILILEIDAQEIHKVEISAAINAKSIVIFSKSQIQPFLLTYEIFNFNVHNCLADSGASSNIMHFFVFQKKNVVIKIKESGSSN
jgi:hypothetical protein